jgi:hypothetical protein
MKVWVVKFIDDVGEAPLVFSTREKAWNYLERYFDRINGEGYKEKEYYKELKESYDKCCQNNGNFFISDYVVIAVEVVVDEEDM